MVHEGRAAEALHMQFSWIKPGLPWMVALALAIGAAYMMNTAVVRALSPAGSSPARENAPSAAVQIAYASSVTIPIIIEDAPCTESCLLEDTTCTGSCESALTIYCVTWQSGVTTQPIVVRASDFSATSQRLACQPRAE